MSANLRSLRQQNHAGGFITTEKDAINLGPLLPSLGPVAVARVVMELLNPADALDTILRVIRRTQATAVRKSLWRLSSVMTRAPKEADRLRDRLQKIVAAFPRVTVTVLGDMVADEFVFGEISRVSREAPVLILRHRERTVVPGGGANAVNNLADLGVNVLPVGIVGNDDAGRLLLRAFRHKHIPVTGILKDKSYPTVTKTRILAGMPHTWRQQVVRVDREPEAMPDRHMARELALRRTRISARLRCAAGFGLRLRRGDSANSERRPRESTGRLRSRRARLPPPHAGIFRRHRRHSQRT